MFLLGTQRKQLARYHCSTWSKPATSFGQIHPPLLAYYCSSPSVFEYSIQVKVCLNTNNSKTKPIACLPRLASLALAACKPVTLPPNTYAQVLASFPILHSTLKHFLSSISVSSHTSLPSSIFHLPSSIFHLPSSIFHLPSSIFHLPSLHIFTHFHILRLGSLI